MAHFKKNETKKVFYALLLTLIYILLQSAIVLLDRAHLNMFNGVISAFEYGVCLLLLALNLKKGLRITLVLMCISILQLSIAIFFRGAVTAIPGLFNSIFYLITLVILYRYNERRERESVTDVLTGVLNRRGLYKKLETRIENQKDFSVIYFSLDNFKIINDSYGHAYGDEMMRKIADRMIEVTGDEGCVARIGGAEFVVAIDESRDATKVAEELLSKIRERSVIEVGNTSIEVFISCYAGIASYPKDATECEALVKYADIAMFEAVSRKSKEVCVFDQDMADYLNRQMEVEKLIKDGLEKDYFYLVYQPQFLLEGKKLRGFETLIRMKDPDGKFVSPGEFIPVAEKGDLILQIDDYVLRRAMSEFKDIVAKNPELILSVNVSAKNIGNLGFVENIRKILKEIDFPATNLEIEITEYCMVSSMEITIDNITELRKMGIQIALDDFGTGYTSLSYVAKLPINLLKVDKSLIDGIEDDNTNREFVHTVISMGHLMGCEVISEGVEHEKQLEYLKQDGCDFVQGYVWGKPLDYDVAKELIETACA